MLSQIPLVCLDEGHSEAPLISENGGESVCGSVLCVCEEGCFHPVWSLPCYRRRVLPASPWRSSLWLHTVLTAWFYQSASLLPLFPALHVD